MIYGKYVNISSAIGRLELLERTRGNIESLFTGGAGHLRIHLHARKPEIPGGCHRFETPAVPCSNIEKMQRTLCGQAEKALSLAAAPHVIDHLPETAHFLAVCVVVVGVHASQLIQ